MEAANDSVSLMRNNDLEGPFLDNLGTQIGQPVWGVGPIYSFGNHPTHCFAIVN